MTRLAERIHELGPRLHRRVLRAVHPPFPLETRPAIELADEPWATLVREFPRPVDHLLLPPARDLDGLEDRFFAENRRVPVFRRALLRMRRARLHWADGFLLLPDFRILLEHHFFFEDHVAPHWSRHDPRRRPRRVSGPAFLLTGMCPNGHYHVMTEVLYRLHGCLEHLPAETTFVIARDTPASQMAAFDALGLPRARLVVIERGDVLEFEDLWYASPVTKSGLDVPETTRWLRSRLAVLADQAPANGAAGDRPRRLHITRRRAGRRRVLNDEALLPLLERHGFVTVECERLPLAEVARLFSEATEIVAPHGAGLVNLLFTRRPGRLLELFPPTVPLGGTCYWSLAHALGWDYAYHRGSAQAGSPDPGDFVAPLEAITRWLEDAPSKPGKPSCD